MIKEDSFKKLLQKINNTLSHIAVIEQSSLNKTKVKELYNEVTLIKEVLTNELNNNIILPELDDQEFIDELNKVSTDIKEICKFSRRINKSQLISINSCMEVLQKDKLKHIKNDNTTTQIEYHLKEINNNITGFELKYEEFYSNCKEHFKNLKELKNKYNDFKKNNIWLNTICNNTQSTNNTINISSAGRNKSYLSSTLKPQSENFCTIQNSKELIRTKSKPKILAEFKINNLKERFLRFSSKSPKKEIIKCNSQYLFKNKINFSNKINLNKNAFPVKKNDVSVTVKDTDDSNISNIQKGSSVLTYKKPKAIIRVNEICLKSIISDSFSILSKQLNWKSSKLKRSTAINFSYVKHKEINSMINKVDYYNFSLLSIKSKQYLKITNSCSFNIHNNTTTTAILNNSLLADSKKLSFSILNKHDPKVITIVNDNIIKYNSLISIKPIFDNKEISNKKMLSDTLLLLANKINNIENTTIQVNTIYKIDQIDCCLEELCNIIIELSASVKYFSYSLDRITNYLTNNEKSIILIKEFNSSLQIDGNNQFEQMKQKETSLINKINNLSICKSIDSIDEIYNLIMIISDKYIIELQEKDKIINNLLQNNKEIEQSYIKNDHTNLSLDAELENYLKVKETENTKERNEFYQSNQDEEIIINVEENVDFNRLETNKNKDIKEENDNKDNNIFKVLNMNLKPSLIKKTLLHSKQKQSVEVDDQHTENLLHSQLQNIKIELKETRAERDDYKAKYSNSITLLGSNKNELINMLSSTFERLLNEIKVTTQVKQLSSIILKILNYSSQEIDSLLKITSKSKTKPAKDNSSSGIMKIFSTK